MEVRGDRGRFAAAAGRAFDLYRAGRLAEALTVLDGMGREFAPDPQLLNLAAGCHKGLGDPEQAAACWREALRLSPHDASVINNLGVLAWERGRPAEAESAYRQALRIAPDYPSARYNLGVLLYESGQRAEAETHFRRVLSVEPDHAGAWNNLGNLCRETGRLAEAEAAFRRALAIRPDFADVLWNLSLLYLAQGRYAEGWPLHEARHHPLKTGWRVVRPELPFPMWRGEALAGKSLLLLGEQGMGDQLQFCRYAPLLKAMGVGRLTLVCSAALCRLMRSLEGVDEVLAHEEHPVLPRHDFWVMLHSIPHLTGGHIPAVIPYLAPDTTRAAGLHLPEGLFKVGLSWRGDPGHANDHNRSLPGLTTLAPLWRVPGVFFVSLQKGRGEEEARRAPDGQPLLALGDRIGEFADTAAIVARLDLVITIDSALAHLAGALGKPCWVMLTANGCDWRWMLEGERSPWYPDGMRLYRQTQPGDWSAVVCRVGEELSRLTGNP
ncbi:MAG: glycosyltransferase family protein [Magnetococcales bacterium]|nr:glycosyltransferase family protein [Magnetococcales bacterium]